MNCKCGSVLISDSKVWSCPISKQDLYEIDGDPLPKWVHTYNHSADVPDLRLTVNKSVTVCRQPGPVGKPSGRPRRKTVLHKDTMACCEACNPSGYFRARRLREKLERRRA